MSILIDLSLFLVDLMMSIFWKPWKNLFDYKG